MMRDGLLQTHQYLTNLNILIQTLIVTFRPGLILKLELTGEVVNTMSMLSVRLELMICSPNK